MYLSRKVGEVPHKRQERRKTWDAADVKHTKKVKMSIEFSYREVTEDFRKKLWWDRLGIPKGEGRGVTWRQESGDEEHRQSSGVWL